MDEGTLLPKETLELEIPGKNWTIPGGGIRLLPNHAERLEQIWSGHLEAVWGKPGTAISSVGTGVDEDTEIERGYTEVTVKRRKHQKKFRRLLLQSTHSPVCFVCGFDEVRLLEAAHIIPDSKGGPSSLENGRLMCLNHHKAHDSGMFHFEGDVEVWADEIRPFGAPEDLSD